MEAFFRLARLENTWKKWNCSKGSPVNTGWNVPPRNWFLALQLQYPGIFNQIITAI